MRPTHFIAVALIAALTPTLSIADCVSAPPGHGILTTTQLTNLMVGSTACVAKVGGGWENQEQHSAGVVTDYKKGPTDPIDPTTVIGTYAISTAGDGTSGLISYNYTAGGAFTYYILGNTSTPSPRAGSFDFCTSIGGTSVPATIKKSIGSCP